MAVLLGGTGANAGWWDIASTNIGWGGNSGGNSKGGDNINRNGANAIDNVLRSTGGAGGAGGDSKSSGSGGSGGGFNGGVAGGGGGGGGSSIFGSGGRCNVVGWSCNGTWMWAGGTGAGGAGGGWGQGDGGCSGGQGGNGMVIVEWVE